MESASKLAPAVEPMREDIAAYLRAREVLMRAAESGLGRFSESLVDDPQYGHAHASVARFCTPAEAPAVCAAMTQVALQARTHLCLYVHDAEVHVEVILHGPVDAPLLHAPDDLARQYPDTAEGMASDFVGGRR